MLRRFQDALTGSGRQGWLVMLALATALAGVIVIGAAAASQQVAPEPRSSVVGSVPSPTRANPTTKPTTPKPTAKPTAPGSQHKGHADSKHNKAAPHPTKKAHASKATLVLPASKPVHLSVPAIGVNTNLTTVGLTSADAINVPRGSLINEAAWFRHSPTPGQYGPSVIVGHVDTVNGPSVFFRLGALEPGDTIAVRRADGRTAVFTVDGLALYPDRTKLPIGAIYGGDLSRADLRLITCTNFDSSIGHYRGNTVVFAHLTRVTR